MNRTPDETDEDPGATMAVPGTVPARWRSSGSVAPGTSASSGRSAAELSAATPQDPVAHDQTAELPALQEPAGPYPGGPGAGPYAGGGFVGGPGAGGPGAYAGGPGPSAGSGYVGGPGARPYVGAPYPGGAGAGPYAGRSGTAPGPYPAGPGYGPGAPPSGTAAAGRPYGTGHYGAGPHGAHPGATTARRGGLPPANGGVVAVSVIWRLAVAALAVWAVWEQLAPVHEWGGLEAVGRQLMFFTTISSVLVALVMTLSVLRVVGPGPARQRLEGRVGWFRGLVTTYAVMTAIIFNFLMEGSLEGTLSLVVHLVLPVAMLLDWLFVGRNQDRLGGGWPLLWILPMVGYLALYVWDAERQGQPMYGFLDPAARDFWTTVGALLAAWLVCGFVLWGIGRARGALLR